MHRGYVEGYAEGEHGGGYVEGVHGGGTWRVVTPIN